MGPKYQWYVYVCKTMHYKYATNVRAKSIKEARQLGIREALLVMGNHARITSDEVTLNENP
jgi:hypothetical protein